MYKIVCGREREVHLWEGMHVSHVRKAKRWRLSPEKRKSFFFSNILSWMQRCTHWETVLGWEMISRKSFWFVEVLFIESFLGVKDFDNNLSVVLVSFCFIVIYSVAFEVYSVTKKEMLKGQKVKFKVIRGRIEWKLSYRM